MEDRRMLASINAQYDFELQTHDVASRVDHLSVLITPSASTTFTDDDGDGFADQDCLFQFRAGAGFGLSLGAGPSSNSPLPGNLIAGFNRDRDIDPNTSGRAQVALPATTGVDASHMRFDQLTRRLDGHPNNLNYDFFPAIGSGFNSNSFISGLLNSTGLGITGADLDRFFPSQTHPGFGKPVPGASLPLSARTRSDLIFVIDTTSSMQDDIAAAKASATRIIDQLRANSLDTRIGVVSFRDHPPEGSFPWRTVQKFTCNAATANSGVQSLSVQGGGDLPEALYGALRHAMDSTDLGLWRGGTVPKRIIYITDAPPHSPEPVTGLTLSDIIRQANAGGIVLESGEQKEKRSNVPPKRPSRSFP